ncbi:carboxylate-amine ligase [Rhodococcus sp. PvR044]|jgi:glutamate---cysteine ligase / carboxylate-amine ligase|uniref:carboxylate-amine ligase n=1 Tax=Rhodococcus TaxID=1827 RepID=UPI000BDBFB31|nr:MULTISPECIES: glutamate--cysteine ligase [Rhodococcus]MBP1158295.1 carboxylate-amine ligase [Rhodococcus sp. PvR099]MCZ4554140.1 glutamate--cysteine ligase [Rhodococcus maanshanensis]PTR43732.1 carboxylate-amine ligase [Rhodococcus sp. OK611]SNX90550.1 carboxylate-amine ligase [Rhodococcus sp. OK270]
MSRILGSGSRASRQGSSGPTIGVEEEFLLVDAHTAMLRMDNAAVARSASELGLELQLELTQCQVETNTPICHDARELRAHLLRMRTVAAAAALRHDCRLVATAAPLIGPWRISVTDSDRYRAMAERYGALALEQGICGCHVHVDVPERETAIEVCNHVRPWLPILLALGGNSRIHRDLDTGFASWRWILWSRWPVSGPPPYFDSRRHYEALVDMLVDSGTIMDERMVYWDVRPSSHLPTVEVRVSDVQPTVDDAVLLATIVRALVMTATRAIERGAGAPPVALETLRAASWAAARVGVSGTALDPHTGRPKTPAALVGALLDHVHDALDELGEYRRVKSALANRLEDGNGADWQHRTLLRSGDLTQVVKLAVTRTVQDIARW